MLSSSSFLGALDTDARSPETKFTTHSRKKIWMRNPTPEPEPEPERREPEPEGREHGEGHERAVAPVAHAPAHLLRRGRGSGLARHPAGCRAGRRAERRAAHATAAPRRLGVLGGDGVRDEHGARDHRGEREVEPGVHLLLRIRVGVGGRDRGDADGALGGNRGAGPARDVRATVCVSFGCGEGQSRSARSSGVEKTDVWMVGRRANERDICPRLGTRRSAGRART